MGEEGRVYLSAAGLSQFIHRSNCGWCSADLVWERSALQQRLQGALPEWLPNYEKEYGALALPLKEKLANTSAATIDRLRSPVRAKARPKGRGGTKPGRWLKNQIPVQTDQWDEHRPGFMEARHGGALLGTVKKLRHARICGCAPSKGMTVITACSYDVIIRTHRSDGIDHHRFLTNVKVIKATNLLRLVLLAGAFLEAPDQQHQREHIDFVALPRRLHGGHPAAAGRNCV